MDSRAGSGQWQRQNRKPSPDRARTEGMALYLAGRFDEAMEIEEFQKDFIRRFGEEVLKRKGAPPG